MIMMQDFIWKEVPISSFEDRSFHTSTLYEKHLIIYGGTSLSLKKYLNDIKIFNMETLSYEDFKQEGDEPSSRSGHSACLFDSNKILLFGGTNGGLLHDRAIITIKETKPLTLIYEKITTTGADDLVRSHHSANIYKNKMYVFGGRKLSLGNL